MTSTLAINMGKCSAWSVLFLFVILLEDGLTEASNLLVDEVKKLAPDLFLKMPERVARDGYSLETHSVQTEDGYLLELHRIPGEDNPTPVFLSHGMGSMSDGWVLFGKNRSLAYLLADAGYDVWMGNVRGNLYSNKHITLSPSDPAFWKFSWHEIGMYDMPASIDYVLNYTGHDRLHYIGYSMGGTVAYVLFSERPEYNDKVNVVVTLNSVVTHQPPPLGAPLKAALQLYNALLSTTGNYVFSTYSEGNVAQGFFICGSNILLEKVCKNICMAVFGPSDGLLESDMANWLLETGGGLSAMTAAHYVQMFAEGQLQQYDYGLVGNQVRYGSFKPPAYNLTRITAPWIIYYGATDNLVSQEALDYTSSVVKNVTEVRRVPSEYFNHMDVLSHVRVKELLLEPVVGSLKNYQ